MGHAPGSNVASNDDEPMTTTLRTTCDTFAVLRRRRADERSTGVPTSSNGASSMHVWWEHAEVTAPTVVAATLEIVEPPTVDHLYFWALQATFIDATDRPVGVAHLGLQWYAAHPGHTAVNCGGYRPDERGELTAHAPSTLPSASGNPNTRDFTWRAHTPYRLAIHVDGRGTVTDLDRRRTTLIRRLDVTGATRLSNPVAWSEVFARCDDPSTSIRWSDLTPTPTALHATYQAAEHGGCTNTTTNLDLERGAIVQQTNTERTTPEGRLA